MNQPLERLLKELAAEHRASLRGEALAPEITSRLGATARGRLPRRRAAVGLIVGLILGLGTVSAALLVAWQFRAPTSSSSTSASASRARPALAFSVGATARGGRVGDELSDADPSAREALFSDGSRVRLEEGGRARVDALDADGAGLTLRAGRLDARIVHREGTHWEVRAGAYVIHVVGTRFAAAWEPVTGALTVRLFEGAVEVSGPGLARTRVSAGQRLEASSTAHSVQVSTTSRVIPDENVPGAANESPAAPPPQERPTPGAPAPAARGGDHERWRELAAGGRYREALASLGDGFAARCQRLDGADVISLGDVARLAGDPARAAQAYRSARRRFPALDRPAFALGALAFDVAHDYGDAADWFARYLAEHPGGPLAPEAAGRLLESFQRDGDQARARTAAASYLRAYPDGAYAGLARQALAR